MLWSSRTCLSIYPDNYHVHDTCSKSGRRHTDRCSLRTGAAYILLE